MMDLSPSSGLWCSCMQPKACPNSCLSTLEYFLSSASSHPKFIVSLHGLDVAVSVPIADQELAPCWSATCISASLSEKCVFYVGIVSPIHSHRWVWNQPMVGKRWLIRCSLKRMSISRKGIHRDTHGQLVLAHLTRLSSASPPAAILLSSAPDPASPPLIVPIA